MDDKSLADALAQMHAQSTVAITSVAGFVIGVMVKKGFCTIDQAIAALDDPENAILSGFVQGLRPAERVPDLRMIEGGLSDTPPSLPHEPVPPNRG